MLVPLGSRPPPSDVVDLLLECHERIRRFTSLCVRLAQPEPVPEEEVRKAGHFAARYFSEALPLHTSDEDALVMPRLKGFSDDIDAALQLMSQDHLEHVPVLEATVALCRELEANPGRRLELAPDLGAVTGELADNFDRHLTMEENIIFPAIRSFLPQSVLVGLMADVRAKRR